MKYPELGHLCMWKMQIYGERKETIIRTRAVGIEIKKKEKKYLCKDRGALPPLITSHSVLGLFI